MKSFWTIAALVVAGSMIGLDAHAAAKPAQLMHQAREELKASKLWGHSDGHLEKAEQALGEAQRLLEQDTGQGMGKSHGKGRGGSNGGGGDTSGTDATPKGDIAAAVKCIADAKDAIAKMKLKSAKDISDLLAKAEDEIKAGVAAGKKSGGK